MNETRQAVELQDVFVLRNLFFYIFTLRYIDWLHPVQPNRISGQIS